MCCRKAVKVWRRWRSFGSWATSRRRRPLLASGFQSVWTWRISV